jgi:hypothetical protein
MKMNKQYIPEACVSKDDTRPVLTEINVTSINDPGAFESQHVAMASNGFVAVAVPVELEDDDIPGLVSAEAFRQARKLGKKNDPIHMVLLEGTVRLDNGVELPRPEGTFPDLMRVVPDTSMAERTDKPMFAISTEYVANLGKAMGSGSVVIERFQHTSPLVLYPTPSRSNRMILDAPFGVLMPFGAGERPVDEAIAA